MTDVVTIDAGTLTASVQDRVVTGLLLPYGEQCRSNLGTFSVDPGTFTMPEDVPGILGLNVEHVREQPVGRGMTLLDTPQGVVGTFSVAKGPEGDQALDDIASGKRKHLSVEASGIRIRAGKAVAGHIFGAALVATPAFPSATLLASAPDTPEEKPSQDPDQESVDPQPPDQDEPGQDPDQVDPDQDNPEDKEGTDMGDVATAPDTLQAAQVAPVQDTSLRAMTTLMASSQQMMGDPGYRHALAEFDAAGSTLFGALSDIKIQGTAGPGVTTGVQLPQAIGELWTKVAYQRRMIPLMMNASLTSLTIAGWRWKTPPSVDTWAGNKAAVPSPPVETEPASVTATRLAAAYDVGREFIDFTVPGFWESFWSALTASYAQKSDEKALADVVAGATPLAFVAPPAGVNGVIAGIIQGIVEVSKYGTAAFSIISPELFTSIVNVTQNGQQAYVGVSQVSFPVFGPHITVAGIPVFPGAVGTGKVLVAAREAATFYELPGSPIRVEGVYDMARGGVNPGLFGYFGTFIHQPKGLVLVGAVAGDEPGTTAKGK